jgi:hypothetical protein
MSKGANLNGTQDGATPELIACFSSSVRHPTNHAS